MKTWVYILTLVLLIVTSGLAGYFLHQPKTIVQPESVPVLRQDPALLHRIDSFETVTKVHVYFIDSLRNVITKLKKRHETNINNIDTLPTPALYRKIADYYNRKQ